MNSQDCHQSRQTLSLKVLGCTGKQYRFCLQKNATVQALKNQIEEVCGMPPSRQRLFHGGRELAKGNQMLQDAGISSGQTVHFSPSAPTPSSEQDGAGEAGRPAAKKRSLLWQLLLPSHTGVSVSLGAYADGIEVHEEIPEPQLPAVPEEKGSDAKQKSIWTQLLLPSHSGVEVTLGAYAPEAPEAPEAPKPSLLENGKKIAEPPAWYIGKRQIDDDDDGSTTTIEGNYNNEMQLEKWQLDTVCSKDENVILK